MALKVGELFATANIDTGGFKSGIASMTSKVMSFKKTALVAFGAVGAAIGGVLMSSAKEFAAYEDQLVTSTTVMTDAAKETEEFAKTQKTLDKVYKQLGKETRYTMDEIAAAGTELGRTGYSAEETADALWGVVDVASASGENLPEVAKNLTNVANAFGMEASELGRLGDIFAQAASSSNVSVRSLSEAMKYFAPIAESMGWSEEKATEFATPLCPVYSVTKLPSFTFHTCTVLS